jgi:pyruvate dehydrogenase E1 component alpha subunit
LIEALTYRLGDHTTVDDASRYRDDEEVGRHWKEEPIARTRAYLTAAHRWTVREEETLIESCAAEVERAAAAYLATEPQPAATVFDYLYATLPPAIAAQKARAVPPEES